MQDKTINSALQQLYRQAISGRQEGLDHILALMRARGIEPVAKRQSPLGSGPRRQTRQIVLEALRGGMQDTSEIAAVLMQHRPDLPFRRAWHRVYMVRKRLAQ
jgi:hypothetical protein